MSRMIDEQEYVRLKELESAFIVSVDDTNVEALCQLYRERAAHGLKKYGVTTDRPDLDLQQWVTHALQEAMDLTVYLMRLRRDVELAKGAAPADLAAAFESAFEAWRANGVPTFGRNAAKMFFDAGAAASRGDK